MSICIRSGFRFFGLFKVFSCIRCFVVIVRFFFFLIRIELGGSSWIRDEGWGFRIFGYVWVGLWEFENVGVVGVLGFMFVLG